MRRIWLALLLVLSVGFSVPSVALADDGLIDSFSGGLETLVNPESVKVIDNDPVRDYEYEPTEVVLSAPALREYDEDATTVDYINGTVDSFNSVHLGASNRTLLQTVQWFLANGGQQSSPQGFRVLTAAVGLVFMWWGVRKVIRMIKSAWYKGHASV